MARFAMFAVASLMPLGAWAQEVVILRDGTQFSGRMTSVNGDAISFRDRDGSDHRFNSWDIDSIRFTDRNQAEPDRAYARRDTGGYPAGGQYNGNRNLSSVTLPAGTDIAVRTNENINSQQSNQGRSYSAQVNQDVVDASGNVVIPRGSEARLVVRHFNDNNLALDLQSVSVNGQTFNVNTADVSKTGNAREGVGENKRTAEYVGGTAVLGTLLGAIAGGGKGAAIGALAGGAAGAGAQVLTRGGQVSVPAETILNFRLDSPMNLNLAR